ncbi:hydrolase [Lithospermum erythrorhizon]|uniref:Hydrolase n=1 Tax=Lithospermum erythrorhizon TaxID=34254 RepID=A0AAV3RHG7_LITER
MNMTSSTNKPSFLSLHNSSILISVLSSLLVFSCISGHNVAGRRIGKGGIPSSTSKTVSAIFVFGDSTSDPGNNNFVKTPFRGNFPPYGHDFPNHVATGRFTNGRLVADFVAEHIGVKQYVPPYLDPKLTIDDLKTGVSFASAGSGFDPLTPTIISGVLPMPSQLEYFKEYQTKMEAAFGKEETKKLVKNALYIISAGTNDFVVNYFTLPIRQKEYDLPSYINFCLEQIRQFMQGLMEMGARRIGFASLAPMGCLPLVITLNSDNAISKRGCIEYISAAAREFNAKLEKELHVLQSNSSFHCSRIAILDAYTSTFDILRNQKFGFKEVAAGCCGTGIFEATFLCNSKTPLCSDVSKYFFWDAIHPTEKAYGILSLAIQPTIDYLIKD